MAQKRTKKDTVMPRRSHFPHYKRQDGTNVVGTGTEARRVCPKCGGWARVYGFHRHVTACDGSELARLKIQGNFVPPAPIETPGTPLIITDRRGIVWVDGVAVKQCSKCKGWGHYKGMYAHQKACQGTELNRLTLADKYPQPTLTPTPPVAPTSTASTSGNTHLRRGGKECPKCHAVVGAAGWRRHVEACDGSERSRHEFESAQAFRARRRNTAPKQHDRPNQHTRREKHLEPKTPTDGTPVVRHCPQCGFNLSRLVIMEQPS